MLGQYNDVIELNHMAKNQKYLYLDYQNNGKWNKRIG